MKHPTLNLQPILTIFCTGILILFVCLDQPVLAAEDNAAETANSGFDDLLSLSLEELMDLEVTSVSKQSEKLFQAPAAIYVVTDEDIRRSGVTSIPDALRLVPGIQVAQMNAHRWAVSARGFNADLANKLLVLIDGRTVYTPLFSGVFWDVQDLILDDIDRIEVIRGPGASLWGSNAVNGVINIITKRAEDTQGVLIKGGYGTELQGLAAARYGGRAGEGKFYRVYAKYFNRDTFERPGSDEAHDDWRVGRAGGRFDWEIGDTDSLTVHGDIYRGEEGDVFDLPRPAAPYLERVINDTEISGGNLFSRWVHTFDDGSELSLQTYFDQTYRDNTFTEERRHTWDIELQHGFQFGDRHRILWGLGYRLTTDNIDEHNAIRFESDSRTDHLFSGFIQDEITLIEEKLFLTLGSKFEHNDYTGLEVQPSARLTWLASENHTFWAAVSRAVQTPARSDNNMELDLGYLPLNPPMTIPGVGDVGLALQRLVVDRDPTTTEMLAVEMGWRGRLHDNLFVDVAGFYNEYDHLRSFERSDPFVEMDPAPILVIPIHQEYNNDAETYGFEVAAEWTPLHWWSTKASYTFIQIQGHGVDTSRAETVEEETPHHQVSLLSSWDLPHHVEFDAWLRYVDSLAEQDIDSYVELDLRVGWQPSHNWELSLVGRNLLDSQHPEWSESFVTYQSGEVERSFYLQATARF